VKSLTQEEMSDQHMRVVRETEGSVAGPAGTSDGALMSLSVNDKGRLRYPATSCPRDDITIFCSAWEEPLDINPLKTEFLLNNIYKFSPYLTGNTSRLRYKAQPVNAVWGNSRCLL
jgi:hypothetical protein